MCSAGDGVGPGARLLAGAPTIEAPRSLPLTLMPRRPSPMRPASCRSRYGCSGSARWCGSACRFRTPAPCASCTAWSRSRWAKPAKVPRAQHVEGCQRVEGHTPLPVLPPLQPVRLLGSVGVLTQRDPGRAEAAPWRTVHVRVRPKRPVLAPGQDRGGPTGSGPGKVLPRCIAGDGACPPEDCGGPQGYLAGLDAASSWDALKDLHTMADIPREVVLENRPEVLRDEDKR